MIVATNPPDRPRGRLSDVRHLLDVLQQQAPERVKLLTNAVGMKLVLIPAGSFQMGSPDTEAGRRFSEGPRHEVLLTRPFYLSVHAVTQEQYAKVVGSNPSRFHER